jgi:hypothetical protein
VASGIPAAANTGRPTRALTTGSADPDHPDEMRILQGLATAILGAALGVQVFLSFLLAPTAFRVLDRPVAVRIMEGVFPGYYGFGLVTVGLALILTLILALRDPSPLRWGTIVLLGITLAGTVYAGGILLPKAHAARLRAEVAPAGDLAPLEFSRLHRLAVAVNIAVFFAGAIALALHLAGGAGDRTHEGRLDPGTRVVSQGAGQNVPSGHGL